jgi:hypothetical protein
MTKGKKSLSMKSYHPIHYSLLPHSTDRISTSTPTSLLTTSIEQLQEEIEKECSIKQMILWCNYNKVRIPQTAQLKRDHAQLMANAIHEHKQKQEQKQEQPQPQIKKPTTNAKETNTVQKPKSKPSEKISPVLATIETIQTITSTSGTAAPSTTTAPESTAMPLVKTSLKTTPKSAAKFSKLITKMADDDSIPQKKTTAEVSNAIANESSGTVKSSLAINSDIISTTHPPIDNDSASSPSRRRPRQSIGYETPLPPPSPRIKKKK